jgi:hypothetical protein
MTAKATSDRRNDAAKDHGVKRFRKSPGLSFA